MFSKMSIFRTLPKVCNLSSELALGKLFSKGQCVRKFVNVNCRIPFPLVDETKTRLPQLATVDELDTGISHAGIKRFGCKSIWARDLVAKNYAKFLGRPPVFSGVQSVADSNGNTNKSLHHDGNSCKHYPPFAINGFGRIGKCVLRLAIYRNLNVVAINEPSAGIDAIAHSIKYDSVHGKFPGNVSVKNATSLDIDGHEVQVFKEGNPENIKWTGVDYVIESTGKFTEIDTAKKHMATGVKRVIISAPSKDAPMFVKGVNFDKYSKNMSVVSNASCTTNCAAPIIEIINKKFGIENCLLTTVHAMTSSQHVLDGVKQRSAAGNMVHSTTGAAKAVGIVIPELMGKITGDSIRVPTLDVSLLKLYIIVKEPAQKEEIMCAIWKNATTSENSVVSYIEEKTKLVSSDFVGNTCSAIVDFNQVSVVGTKFMTIGAWYDNEMGYSSRVLDLYEKMVTTS